VSDTGCGIPEDILLQVEEPFFTTKPRGTGLGLSICRKIIEAHGGRMRITSRPGEGTTVEITLPVEFRTTGGPDAAF
jgi:signal transduction histidine kinase